MNGPNYSQQLRTWTEVGNVNLQMAEWHGQPIHTLPLHYCDRGAMTQEEVVRRRNPNATISEWNQLYEEIYNGKA